MRNPYLLNDYQDQKSNQAKWISLKGVEAEKNCYLIFRKTFVVDKLANKTLRLRVSADSRYQLFLNGTEVGIGPVRGTNSLLFYDLYNIQPLIKIGENFLEIRVHSALVPNFLAMEIQAALYLEVEGILVSDKSWQVTQDVAYRQDVELHTFQTGFSEWRDYSRKNLKFKQAIELPKSNNLYQKTLEVRDVPSLEDTIYYPNDIVKIATIPACENYQDNAISKLATFEPHTVDYNRVDNFMSLLNNGEDQEHATIKVAQNGDGVAIVLNFDQEILGRFFIDLKAPAGTIIDVIVEEELYKDDRLRAEHLNPNGYHFCDRYIANGERQTIDNSLHERGFRMLQLNFRNFNSDIELFRVYALDQHYPFIERGSFFSSDFELNRIFDVCQETLKKCTSDVYIDCPWRERAFWVNDMIVENKMTLLTFGASELHKRAFKLAFSQSHANGFVDGVCPCSIPEGLSLVATNLFLPMMLEEYLLHSGDRELVKNYLPNMCKIIETFQSWTDDKGIIRVPKQAGLWNFIDWSYDQNGRVFEGKATSMMNLFYVISLQKVIRLAEMLDVNLPLGSYQTSLEKVYQAVFKYFYVENEFVSDTLDDNDKPEKLYSQLSHSLIILSNMASPKELKIAQAALFDKRVLQPEFYLHYFIFRALNKIELPEESLKRIRQYWGNNVKTGTPTLWESGIHHKGKMAFLESGSLCHGFGTSPLEFCLQEVLGITPLTDGFKEFLVTPKSFDLNFAHGRVPTPNGNIDISWVKADGKIELTLRVPNGTTAILESGEKLKSGKYQITLDTLTKFNTVNIF